MLDPYSRRIYLNELRPPDGFRLDRAIATTFSLDLLSLLMAPLSMALSDSRSREEAISDPIALLEAVRRTAGRFAVFCQKGRIAVPKVDSRLYSYLEPSVVEVQAPYGGVFHPKVWLLRFTADNEAPFYRFLCLSRNLTFDHSWDTVLSLEGRLEDRRNAFSVNHPLGDFLARLPELTQQERVPAAVAEHVAFMADEVRRVRFEPPEAVDSFSFIPVGVQGYRRPPGLGEFNRLLIVSPFLSDGQLKPITSAGQNHVLISRAESLDALQGATLDALPAKASLYVMADEAQRPEETDQEEAAPAQSDPLDDLSGLHAKLYIAEKGWGARVLTGSVNATDAAWTGTNVEFMVELSGMRSQIGIEKFLGDTADKQAFRQMLQPYERPAAPEALDAVQHHLEKALETARRAVAGADLRAVVTKESEGTYALAVGPGEQLVLPPDTTGRCYPISLRQPDAVAIATLADGKPAVFRSMAAPALTGFIAFELTATLQGKKASVAFVLNLPVDGMPADRGERIVQSIISDRGRFLRYLLFLLAEGSDTFSLQELLVRGTSSSEAAGDEVGLTGLPLLEELVRAYSRQPQKIDRIDALVRDLRRSEEGRALLPDGFEEVWEAFLAARGTGVAS